LQLSLAQAIIEMFQIKFNRLKAKID